MFVRIYDYRAQTVGIISGKRDCFSMKDSEILEFLSEYSTNAKVGLAPPAVTLDTILECRQYCETNECGCYNNYCSCPPRCGTPEERLEVLAHYSKSAIAPILYEADYRDKEAMDECIGDLQDTCREMVTELRKMGLDCLGMADGGCKYCDVCSAKEDKPCRCPDKQIQSVSGNGIKMMDYLKASHVECVMKDGFIEMYAVILYN